MTGVRLLGVTVTLGGCAVLDAVSLTVEPGAWAALVGPNGAGKTTALRTIAGAVAHRGTVMLGSQDAATLGRRERARRVAVVPQTPAAPADMRVREYVLLGRTPHLRWFGRESAADGAAADEALARLALTPFGARPLGSLSGGERQRAVLARALAQDPDVLLLDEPTSALDVARQQQVLELVDGLRRDEGLTVVAAMHDLTSVGLYADDVHLLSAGRLVASGPPDEVLEPALLSEHFGAAVRVIEHDGALVVVPVRTASVPGGTA